MAVTDLYAVLKEYTHKIRSPHIEKLPFIETLIVTANYKARTQPAWKVWQVRPREKFDADLAELTERGVVEIAKSPKGDFIFIPSYYCDCVREVWAVVDGDPDRPFPDISSIGTDIPSAFIQNVDIEAEFHALLKEEEAEELPLIQLSFPDQFGSIMLTKSIIQARLLDTVITRLKDFLNAENHKEFYFKKMNTKIPGMATKIDSVINCIMLSPFDCKNRIKEADASDFLVWNALSQTIIESVVHKEAMKVTYMSAVQGAYILESFVTFYRDKALENDSSIQLSQIINDALEQEPYAHTMKMLCELPVANGDTLASRYTREAILSVIKKKTSVPPHTVLLPEVLVFVDSAQDKWYIAKPKLYHAFEILRKKAYSVIERVITKRWTDVLLNYEEESSMRNYNEFEKLINKIAIEETPLFAAIYSDGKFVISKEELRYDAAIMDLALKNFDSGILRPMYQVLGIHGTAIVKAIKINLPFWHSLPFLVSIIRFFKRRV